VPHIIYYALHACTVTLKKVFPVTCNNVFVFCRDGHLEWVYDEAHLDDVALYLINNAEKNPDFIKNFYSQWKKYFEGYIQFCKKVDRTDLSKLSDKEFLSYYHKFTELYCLEYSLSMLCDHFSFYSEHELKEKLSQEDFIILTTPSITSFVSEEQTSLLKIYQNLLSKGKSIREISKKDKLISKQLTAHLKKYFWISNTYKFPQKMTEDYFISKLEHTQKDSIDVKKRLTEISNFSKETKTSKQTLLKKIKLDNRTKLIITLIDVFADIHDKRKKANLMASSYAYFFMNELSRRTKIPIESLKFVMPPEVDEILKAKSIDKKLIEPRMQSWVVYYVDNEFGMLDSNESENLYKNMFNENIDTNEIKGITASPGRAIGRAKIIYHSTASSKMEKGDILIASMTRPDYMPAIHKAAAIVTDEGGITCHAAIISRELKIPCIIATKIATKVLKDGDLIEVDATHGKVKILERK
jgi:phosphohistidine swiveling domain-containing protein